MRLLDETTHDRGALFEEILVGLRASSQVMTVDVFEGHGLQMLRKLMFCVWGKGGQTPAFRCPETSLFYFSLFFRPQKMNVPSFVPVTTSIEPSLFKSVASTVEPTPEFVSISSGSNRAPPGALGSRIVLYQ